MRKSMTKSMRKSMRKSRVRGYIKYGPTPRNEYTQTNTEKDANAAAVSEKDTQADETAHKQSLSKPPAQYQPSRGWKRSGRANGWRAELASRQDETAVVRRYYKYGRKNNHAVTMVSFTTEEMSLINIYKADTRKETMSNMKAAQTHIDDTDMLAVLDSAANKLYGITDATYSEAVFDLAYTNGRQ